jgi:hypothetical protein
VINGWEECAEFMNEALGPLDNARRAVSHMHTVARGLGIAQVPGELLAEVEQIQHQVAQMRTKFDDLAEQHPVS